MTGLFIDDTFENNNDIETLAPVPDVNPYAPSVLLGNNEQTPVLLDLLTRLSAQIRPKKISQAPINPTPTISQVVETTTATVFVPVLTAATVGKYFAQQPDISQASTSSASRGGDDTLEWVWIGDNGRQGRELISREERLFTPSQIEPSSNTPPPPRFHSISSTRRYPPGIRRKKTVAPDAQQGRETPMERWVWPGSSSSPPAIPAITTSPSSQLHRWIPNSLAVSPGRPRYARSGFGAYSPTTPPAGPPPPSQPHYWYSDSRQTAQASSLHPVRARASHPVQARTSPPPKRSTSFFRMSRTYG